LIGTTSEIFLYYPEVLFSQLLPAVLKIEPSSNKIAENVWHFLTTLVAAIDELEKRERLPVQTCKGLRRAVEQSLLKVIREPLPTAELQPYPSFAEVGYHIRRKVLQFLGRENAHPACALNPAVVSATVLQKHINIMQFHLSRFQIGQMLDGGRLGAYVEFKEAASSYRTNNPVRPFTLTSITQLLGIVVEIRRETKVQWTLPTEDEWRAIATEGSERKWPWGDTDPERYEHASLLFEKPGESDTDASDLSASSSERTKEVGLFPRGASSTKVYDLIGNVYDPVFANENNRASFEQLIDEMSRHPRINDERIRELLKLCGGAWYVPPNKIQRRLVRAFAREAPSVNNIGVRLMLTT
jgi:hypothetical protein